ncbi:hypothetical protein ABH931_000151 [Streptacidiphilus sp. MAP12-33]|uniref:hypothetical protein n=1 Tax=Streptacidiphilus sp. MAP12-33 TaxID=3156266 RepID=UPI00351354AC
MNRPIMAAAALVAVLALTGCGFSESTSTGVVIDHGPRHNPATHSEEWWLTVRQSDGATSAFRVLINTYDRCPIGAHYPACKMAHPRDVSTPQEA